MSLQIKKVSFFSLLIAVLFIFGCVESDKAIKKRHIKDKNSIERQLHYQKRQSFFSPIKLRPIQKKIDILDLARVNFYAKGISYKDAIVQILQSKSVNVAFDSRLDNFITQPNIDVSLNNVTLREALNTIVGIVGASWQRKDKTIWITPFETKTYDLGFLSIIRTSTSSLGGDVLGGQSASDTDITTPLKGSFAISSKSTKNKGDIYKVIQDNIKALLSKNGQFTLDPASGVLMVKDRPQNIKLIEQYIKAIYKSYNRQVVIEAKIIEVGLTDSWKLGIDWNLLSENSNLGQVINVGQQTIDFGKDNPALNLNISRIFHTENTQITLNSVVNALSEFGTVKLVSEPHLRVMNSQPAILSVGRSISFIKKIEITTETVSGGTSTTSPEVDISSIFDGIVFGITPFIKSNGSVLLRIVPIKSSLISLQEKNISGNTYTLPQVDLREASTVVSATSGDIIVLGGLISQQTKKSSNGVPVLSEIPALGTLFKQQGMSSDNVELVILLRPVIVQ